MFVSLHHPPRRRNDTGFSLLEVVVVLGIVLVVLATALFNLAPSINTARSNTGMELVIGELRRAHERAIDERRIYRVTFVPPQTIQVDVGQVANIASTITGTAPAFVQSQAPLTLPPNTQFAVVRGIPTTPQTTPDGFGSGNNPIDLDIENGGGGTQIYFQPDGRALDSANRLNDGVIYIAQPNNLFSSRAVSLYGSTGRVKAWFLSKVGGATGWSQ
jgi:prepilin-type N-terminal cleavage/methylation domain-containing protein